MATNNFLPLNKNYHPVMSAPMEEVEAHPEVYILEECIEACKILWSKNIYTFMVSDRGDIDSSWIEVFENGLSPVNMDVIKNMTGEDIIKYKYHRSCINFGVKCVGQEAKERLIELANSFQMQDVCEGYAYMSVNDALINLGICRYVENPDYYPMESPYFGKVSFDNPQEFGNYIVKYEKWQNSINSKETLPVYDPTKLSKPKEEYFKEAGFVYVPSEERVYLSDYHYQKHLNYLKSLNDDNKNNLEK